MIDTLKSLEPDYDDGLNLTKLIQLICKADQVLSEYHLPIRNEAALFRASILKKLKTIEDSGRLCEDSGRLCFESDHLYKKIWTFYIESYLPALAMAKSIKALRESDKTGQFVNPETGELGGVRFYSNALSASSRYVFFPDRPGEIWVCRVDNGRNSYRSVDFSDRVASFENNKHNPMWSACWQKSLNLRNVAPFFFNVCRTLDAASGGHWVYLWRGDYEYWKYKQATGQKDVTPEILHELKKAILPESLLPLSRVYYVRETPVLFCFYKDGHSVVPYPYPYTNAGTNAGKLLQRTIKIEDATTTHDCYACIGGKYEIDSFKNMGDKTYLGKRYVFREGGSVLNSGGTTFVPIIVRDTQLYHETGLNRNVRFTFRNEKDSALFGEALQYAQRQQFENRV